ncbi:MAG: molybdopterin-dependent oxidoreductase [Actinomycetota bacterium]
MKPTLDPDPRPARTARRSAATAGLAGMSGLTAAGAVLNMVVPVIAFPPVAIAQTLIRLPPGRFDTIFIDLLGHWALRLAVIGTAVAFVASGLPLGLLIRRLARGDGRNPGLVGAGVFVLPWIMTVALYPSLAGHASRAVFAAVQLPLFLAAGAFAGRTYRRLATPARHMPNVPQNRSRRTFVRAATLGGAGIAVGLLDPSRFLYRRPDPGDRSLHLANVTPAAAPTPATGDAAFAAIPGLTTEITPLADFYVVNEEIIRPDIDPATWRLSIRGLVGHPVELTHDDLLSMPAVERYQTLECISNPVGGDIMSTQRWTGVPLARLLERTGGMTEDAVEVVFRSVGGYSDSMPVEQALDEETLIAIGMGGNVLPRAHGFPARLLGVGTFGMKNPKWLGEIEVVGDPYDGYWERRGWTKEAIVRTMSRIDTPRDGEEVAGRVVIAGVAFAGDRGISAVEVSADGGVTWNPAQLKTALSPLTWRLWRFDWEPTAPGDGALAVRATDGTGAVQEAAFAEPYPSGATGYDEVGVTVR